MNQYSGQDWEQVVFTKKPSNLTNISNAKVNKKNNIDDDEIVKKTVISSSNSQLIQQGRLEKGFKQKDLAQKINVDSRIIQEYESGKTAPNYSIMCKIEKILNIKLNKSKKQ